MKQRICADRQTDKYTVFHDIGHNASMRGPYEGGLIDPIERMPIDLPQAQVNLPALWIVSSDAQSDRLANDKRVVNGSIAA
jgi:hypothetical protein